ncbi:beta-propeller domain-containing protein [Paenibacillus sp. HJGM_3]|uniref:beta-propeller domain-containing protein n=1 Tax=Paenibacillus sp. HJGM_3 TaxID=3379816 RepID=UPI00385DF2C5
MKKWILPALLILVLLVAIIPAFAAPPGAGTNGAAPTASANEVEVNISLRGQPMAVERAPFLADNVTLVPLRSIAEALGAQVDYNESDHTIQLRKDSSVVHLTLGSLSAQKNGQLITLEAAPRLSGDITMVPVRFISETFDMLVTWDDATRTVHLNDLQQLPTVGSLDNLKKLVEEARTSMNGSYAVAMTDSMAVSKEAVRAPQAAAESGAGSSANAADQKSKSGDYSTTNTQVEGVDEADVVKTDGTYLYQVNRMSNEVLITQAYPSTEMKLVSTLNYKDQNFSPTELYVDDRYLVVIGNAYQPIGKPTPMPMPMESSSSSSNSSNSSLASGSGSSSASTGAAAPGSAPVSSGAGSSGSTGAATSSIAALPSAKVVADGMMIYPGYSRSTLKAYIYDIADKANPKQVRDLELEGSYVSSRKIGSALYLVANQYVNLPYAVKQPAAITKDAIAVPPTPPESSVAPSYRDSAVSNDFRTMDYGDIRYFPGSVESNYMIVAGLDLNNLEKSMNVSAYLGSGQNVFASDQNLYVAVTKYTPIPTDAAPQDSTSPITPEKKRLIAPRTEPNTTVYKFRLDQGSTKYVAQGDVPGTVLNQFSMDEYNQHFRIATTKGYMWANGADTSKNNVYILNEALTITGKLENIAPGERIYSTRFMGNRAYMVTFKNVDPLFALDLSNPSNPTILGALKIPGYSDYLHPYDENHLIGFGKETVETTIKGGAPGVPDQTMAYYLGMKISLFDVTDVAHPVEQFKEVIGDRGTYSELLNNHKALLFSKENNLLAFPVTVMTVKNNTTDRNGMPAYGQFDFQGAYVYNLDLQSGFKLRARITHMTEDERLKSGNGYYNGAHNVDRILYIKDTLYTLSPGMIKTNDLLTLKEKDSLPLPTPTK